MFLLTCRPKLRTDLHGFTYLIEVLDLTLRSVADENKSMSDQEVELCSEILKILFNLTVSIDRDNMDEVGCAASIPNEVVSILGTVENITEL